MATRQSTRFSTLQNPRLSDVLSSPDRLHRMLHIHNQNRGMSRNGLIDGKTAMSRSLLPGQIAYQLRTFSLNGEQRIKPPS